jgi:hypothetical protein
MSGSLVEMVLAIAIAGIVFACAIVPTTNVVMTYQRDEGDLRLSTVQSMAALRVEQVGSSLWRDKSPPDGHAMLKAADGKQLSVGEQGIRLSKEQLQQRQAGGAWALLAEPVDEFAFTYQLSNGKWVSKVDAADSDDLIAIQYDWTDPQTSQTYGGTLATTDRMCWAEPIQLPEAVLDPPKYDRSEYQETIELPLGSWP